MKKLKIAVFGAGLIGRVHVEKILANPRTELAYLVDPLDATKDYAASLKVPHYKTPEEGLAKEKADGVIVATPNTLHVPQGLLCVEHKLPAIIEKPFASSVADGERLVEASETKGVPLLTGHHRRHNPIVMKAKEVIASGALGEIVAVQVATLYYKPDDYFEAGQWRKYKGAGPVLINLIHDVDLMRHLIGEVTELVALGSNARRGFEVEDTAAVAMRFANGALGSLIISDKAVSSKSWENTSGETPQYPHDKTQDYIYITGTKGALSIPTMRLHTYEGKTSWYSPLLEQKLAVIHQDPLVNQLNNLCDVIEGKAKPLVSAREGLESLRLVEKVSQLIRI